MSGSPFTGSSNLPSSKIRKYPGRSVINILLLGRNSTDHGFFNPSTTVSIVKECLSEVKILPAITNSDMEIPLNKGVCVPLLDFQKTTFFKSGGCEKQWREVKSDF